ncbi:MAG: response regulator [Planctomycetota bacterium]|jgi:CheY-like chemotaxis protein|nr:response regulator [Planctomycetales bacterium]RLT04524.1 MAG: response regulator [Planctomycetota bacterium]
MAVSRQRMLVIGNTASTVPKIKELTGDRVEVISCNHVRLPDVSADYVVVDGSEPQLMSDLQVCAMGLLSALPDGIVLLDDDLTVLWHNSTFRELLRTAKLIVGQRLHDVILPADGTDLRRIPIAASCIEAVSFTVRCEDRSSLGLRLARTAINLEDGKQSAMILTVRDVSMQVLEKQKQDSIYRAGLEMGNLTAEEVTAMSHEERVMLLKDQILQFTQEILGYDTFEIRLNDPETHELIPLLEDGMDAEAAVRTLYAFESGNGVTGFVAFSKRSYLCSDTQNDPLYLRGASDARSSLTVPLMIRDTVLGTFNVESPGTLSFNQTDLDFLTLFSRVVASSLNQLQLLAAEKVTVETENSDRLRREISKPSDEILNAATWVLERYIGHDPDVCDRLHLITDRVRKISGHVGSVPGKVDTRLNKTTPQRPPRKALMGKRVLVVDQDSAARDDAHNLLGQMGCEVEAVQNATEGCAMLRNYHYDVVLTDIRLSDANGYECFRRLREINSYVPIIMMTGFGYDASHSIVKARQEGLKAVLYKPFRRAQMLDEVEKAVTTPMPG